MSTRPRLPFSFPAMTATVSLILIAFANGLLPCLSANPRLEHFRREGDDLSCSRARAAPGPPARRCGCEGLALGLMTTAASVERI